MDRNSAKTLITNTLCNKFDKTQYRNFIVNFLDGIDENKIFTCGNAYVPEAFREYITSYGRFGKYTDKNNETIEVLWVSLKKDTSLDRARTVQRNFVAWYLNGGRGGQLRKNALVAFYNEDRNDWRFSFVKLDTALIQDDKGKIKIVNNFTPAKRFSFLVGEFEPNHTAQSRLVSLLEKDYPTLDEIEEAFNVEKVSKEFFDNYKELFLQLTEDLKNIRENESSQRINAEFTLKSISDADFCKKLLGQLVFLYFIQKKGWLGVTRDKKWGEGDKQFLRHTFERAINEGKNFFNDYLEPLFYNALANGERDDNWFGELDCKIPFLNGGLFERYHDYDWVNTDIVFDNTIFSNNKKTKNGDIGTGILDVFDRYNFTVKEDEPLEKEVAVDPEMLGKVFENLLEVQDRKSKGAFYTPREIVHYMCQESLINYLCTELGVNEDNNNISDSTNLTKQDIEDFIHHSDKISQLENIATDKENENSKYKHIFSDSIKNNAKAIDKALEDIKICDPAIGSGAFPVGMLNEIVRARIALVESGFLPEAKKRTTYEYKRQAIQNSIYGVDIESGAVEIAKLRLWLSLVVDEEDIENIKALPNLDYKIVCGNSLLGVERNLFNDTLFKQLEELKPQFFNETRKSEKRRLKKQIDATIKELTKDGTFDFVIYFSEVFHEKGGFDVVIANPPYVQIPKKIYSIQRFPFSEGKDKGKQNLYKLFIELAYNICKKKGYSTLIVQSSLMCDISAQYTRELLLTKTSIDRVIEFAKKAENKSDQVFESVLQGTCIVIYQKTDVINDEFNVSIGNDISTITNLSFEKESQSKLLNFYPNGYFIPLIRKSEFDIIDKIFNNSTKLKELVLKTKKGDLSSDNDKSLFKDVVSELKLIRGCNIQKYGVKEPYDNVDFSEKTKKAELENRNNKIIAFQNITGTTDKWRLHSCLFENKSNIIFLDTTIKILLKPEINEYCLLGILNSKLLDWFFRKTSTNNHVNGYEVESLPITKNYNNNELEEITKKMINLIAENSNNTEETQKNINLYQQEIDKIVYKLYNLTYEEVLTIDKNFELSEQDYK